jgi:transposase
VDARGVPLAWVLTGANRHDITQLEVLLDRVPPVRGRSGRPRHRPDLLVADRGYDYKKYRRRLRQRGIPCRIAKRQTEHGSGLGRWRWVVERSFAWIHQFRRLHVRYERRGDIHQALLALACCVICWRALRPLI